MYISPVRLSRISFVGAHCHVLVEVCHAALAAGHGCAQSGFIDLLAGLVFDKAFHLAQLGRYILDSGFGLFVRNVGYKMRDPEIVGESAEGQRVGVTGQRC